MIKEKLVKKELMEPLNLKMYGLDIQQERMNGSLKDWIWK